MSLFPISRFCIKFQALENIHLPAYAGSTLRGAFGHALKNIACLTASNNRDQCQCQPAESCLYRRIFDPAKQQLMLQNRVQDIAPPFLIEVHSLPTRIAAGQNAHFYMVLFGEFAHRQQVLIQLAWQRALAIGLGEQRTTGQVQSQLRCIELCDRPQLLEQISHQFKIKLLSHTRIQHHGKILTAENFDPAIFCHSVLRRYLTLIEAYSDEALEPQHIQSLYEDIKKVQGNYQVDPVQWSRWSNRQKQKMQMDGLLGEIKLSAVSMQLANILYLGQWLHAGKGSVFGLGQYILQPTKIAQLSA